MKKKKIKILIWITYWISLFIFGILGVIRYPSEISKLSQEMEGLGVLVAGLCVPGIYHFVFVSIIAIIVTFIKEINIEYKKIIYWFPLITFLSSIWITMICFRIALFFGFMNG